VEYPRDKKEVYTMSDQLRPAESTGTEIRKDDEGEGHYLLVGKGLSDEEIVDALMAFQDEHRPDSDEPPSPPS
jgi:hypothetical protein